MTTTYTRCPNCEFERILVSSAGPLGGPDADFLQARAAGIAWSNRGCPRCGSTDGGVAEQRDLWGRVVRSEDALAIDR